MKMKCQLFRDIDKQLLFERDGYVVIDFTSEAIVRDIEKKIYEQNPIVPEGFSSGASIADDEIKQKLFQQIDQAMHASLEHAFINYKKLGCTFLCKAPGESGKVNVHQDWTVVDETKYSSATVWIPTHDVDERNGALRVLPGSHLFFDKYRNNHIPVSYRYSEQLLWDNMLTVPMKPGQAFVLNHAVIHASAVNMTNKERLVIVYGITSEEAKLCFYFSNYPKGRVEKFDMPDDFFLRYYNIGERPLFGDKVDEFDYPVPIVSGEEISELIQRERNRRASDPYFQQHWSKSPTSL
jgi:hypothetical protein